MGLDDNIERITNLLKMLTGADVQDRAFVSAERRAGVVREHDADQGLPHRDGHGLGRAQALPPGRPQAQGVQEEAPGGAKLLQVRLGQIIGLQGIVGY